MINKGITDLISKRLNIKRRDFIEKDIILSKILFYLSKDEYFFKNYAFKGGTCLIKCYLGYYRFSEDLDFTYLNQKEFTGKSQKKIRGLISGKIDRAGKIIENLSKTLDLDFKIEKENKRYIELGGSNAFVTFKIWYKSGELEKETFVKIQINHIEKLEYPVRELHINSLIPKRLEKEFSFLEPEETEILLKPVKIKVYDIKEILLEKIRAILTRRGIKARDFVDAFLIINKEKLDLNKFKPKAIEKMNAMLKFEKYAENLKNKENQLKERLILGEEEKLLLIPISKDFPKFIEEFMVFLKKIIDELKMK